MGLETGIAKVAHVVMTHQQGSALNATPSITTCILFAGLAVIVLYGEVIPMICQISNNY